MLRVRSLLMRIRSKITLFTLMWIRIRLFILMRMRTRILHQNDANQRSLVFRPSTAPFCASTPQLREYTTLAPFWNSRAPEFLYFNSDPDPQHWLEVRHLWSPLLPTRGCVEGRAQPSSWPPCCTASGPLPVPRVSYSLFKRNGMLQILKKEATWDYEVRKFLTEVP